MATQLLIRQLAKSFRGIRAVDHVDMDIGANTVHAVIGPNGAGKTTLLNCVSGFLRADEGQVFLGDSDITGLPPHELVRVGVVRTFQITTLFDELTVRENVELAAGSELGRNLDMYHRAAALDEVRNAADKVLTKLDLMSNAGQRADQLDHGNRRVLEIALALALKPRILLLDEPTAGMSRAETTRISEIIRELARDVSIVLVEHDTEMVLSISDRITVMVRGRVIADGPPDEISRDTQVHEAYLGVG